MYSIFLVSVFTSIQRRHYEQLKVAVPVVLNVLKDISLETNAQVEALFDNALGIAFSMREVSSKLVCKCVRLAIGIFPKSLPKVLFL